MQRKKPKVGSYCFIMSPRTVFLKDEKKKFEDTKRVISSHSGYN